MRPPLSHRAPLLTPSPPPLRGSPLTLLRPLSVSAVRAEKGEGGRRRWWRRGGGRTSAVGSSSPASQLRTAHAIRDALLPAALRVALRLLTPTTVPLCLYPSCAVRIVTPVGRVRHSQRQRRETEDGHFHEARAPDCSTPRAVLTAFAAFPAVSVLGGVGGAGVRLEQPEGGGVRQSAAPGQQQAGGRARGRGRQAPPPPDGHRTAAAAPPPRNEQHADACAALFRLVRPLACTRSL